MRFVFLLLAVMITVAPLPANAEGIFGPVPKLSQILNTPDAFGPVPKWPRASERTSSRSGSHSSIFGPVPLF